MRRDCWAGTDDRDPKIDHDGLSSFTLSIEPTATAWQDDDMDVAHAIALRARCNHLFSTFFVGVTHAPSIYMMLGRSLENVACALERLDMEASHPLSRASMAPRAANGSRPGRVANDERRC